MNICLFIISNGWGGAETVVYELAKHLQAKGENVSVVLNREIIKYYEDLDGVQIFDIGSFYPQRRIKVAFFRGALSIVRSWSLELFRPLYHKMMHKRMVAFLKSSNSEIIHAHMPEAILLTSTFADWRIPKAASLHGEASLTGRFRARSLMELLRKWKAIRFKRAIEKINRLTFVSDFLRHVYEEQGFLLESKSVVIYNGIDGPGIKNSSSVSLQLEGNFNLLFPGGAKWKKGGDFVIRALAKVKQEIPDIHLYFALDVPKTHFLRRIVEDLKLEKNISFTGFLPKGEYRTLLNSVDLLVMPSRWEEFGIVYIEAMVLGKPIIAGNVGGVTEVLNDTRNGILVHPDENEVADAILRLYQDKNLRKQMAENNVKDVKKFSWNSIADQYIEFYRSLIQDNS